MAVTLLYVLAEAGPVCELMLAVDALGQSVHRVLGWVELRALRGVGFVCGCAVLAEVGDAVELLVADIACRLHGFLLGCLLLGWWKDSLEDELKLLGGGRQRSNVPRGGAWQIQETSRHPRALRVKLFQGLGCA